MPHCNLRIDQVTPVSYRQLICTLIKKKVVDVSPKEQHVNIVKLKEAKKKVIQYGPMETMAYLATQTAIQYSLAKRIMLELKFQDAVHKRNFRPRSLLDFGTGPGTNIWYHRQLHIEFQYSLTFQGLPGKYGEHMSGRKF